MRTAIASRSRRPRGAPALTVALLDALAHPLSAPLHADDLLIATARIVANELECLCMIERITNGETRLVGLAHPDPALAERLRVVHQPHVIVSGARAECILRRGAPLEAHDLGAAELEEHGLAELERWTGRKPSAFVAVPLVARGEALGVMWLVSTRRARRLRAVETESVARAAAVVSLALSAAHLAQQPGVPATHRRAFCGPV